MSGVQARTAPGTSTLEAVVHDLHAPLTIIRGLCVVLARDDPRFDRRRVAAMLDAETLRLAEGLRSLTSAAGGAGGATATTDLAAVAGAAAERFMPAAALRDVTIVVRGARRASWVAGERGHIERALDNLLQNALRHTPEGGTILLGISRRAGFATLRVRDDGPGVARVDRERIFRRGKRGSRPSGAGSGLGLTIARELVEASGGRLTLDPVGEGACFRLALPLTAAPGGPRAA
jgi:two-component system OmpR family sensor kinase